jgi:hypothetical protein
MCERIYLPVLEAVDGKTGYPQLEKLIIMRMKGREEMGMRIS